MCSSDLGRECHGGSAFWHSDSADYVYIWPCFEHNLKRWNVDYLTGTLDTSTLMESTMSDDFIPGGIISVSSNGSQVGSGILWANVPLDWSNIGVPNRPSILRAFDASDITHELWNSQMNADRDSIRNFPKFVPPTIANGRVYMSTFSGFVNMYGIFSPDGIEEQVQQPIQVYPNPFTGVVNVWMKDKSREMRIVVCNAIGEKVFEADKIGRAHV